MSVEQQHAATQQPGTGPRKPVAARAPVIWLRVLSLPNLFLLAMLTAVMLSALAVVGLSHKSRSVFFELQQQRDLHNELEVQWGQLLIEQSTFGTEGRIERRAVDELEMKVPDWSGIVMVRHE